MSKTGNEIVVIVINDKSNANINKYYYSVVSDNCNYNSCRNNNNYY